MGEGAGAVFSRPINFKVACSWKYRQVCVVQARYGEKYAVRTAKSAGRVRGVQKGARAGLRCHWLIHFIVVSPVGCYSKAVLTQQDRAPGFRNRAAHICSDRPPSVLRP